MSKNKHHRNFSYNNQNPNSLNANVEDIESSENKLDEVSDIEDEVTNKNTEEISIDEVPQNMEMEIGYSDIDVVSQDQIVLPKTVEGHSDPIGELGDSGIISNEENSIVMVTACEFKYEIATDLVNGQKIGYKESTNDLDLACNIANNETKNTGVVHHVYNDQGFVVFSAKKKLTLLTNKKRGNKNVNWYS